MSRLLLLNLKAGHFESAAKRAGDPVQALRNQVRQDIGRFPSLSAEAVHALTLQYRAHPGWTAQLHHDNLRVILDASGTKCPSYPSVRRYLKAQGLLRQRPLRRARQGAVAARDRLEEREVRSYEVEHVLQLMHLDLETTCTPNFQVVSTRCGHTLLVQRQPLPVQDVF